ncbi:hypothetical protein QBC35DRAFT_525651 [Podospora australis]|uniref:Alpha/beta hydrolase fold-3 domain-containing protein n=1 Tax=Podospora australis TaxID=1536484 RepID=A0AAN7AF21_9PEZI|nr:hypothetical protein QBC35DRAFT_525651 [Podospora australis]
MSNGVSKIPTDHPVGTRSHRPNGAIEDFLADHPELVLGGESGYTMERRNHQKIFGIHNLPDKRVNPIDRVEFTAIRGPHGTIPIRVLYPSSGKDRAEKGECGALIYMHGGGYTIGSVDEWENSLRFVAEVSGCQVYAVEYRLAPEFRYPVQLDEYDAVIDFVQGEGGSSRGVSSDRVMGGGDSAGGSITAAVCLRRRDQGKKPLSAQVLLYPAARLPFDTPAARENNPGYYLQCNGIFGFADHYLPRPNQPHGHGATPGDRYISPGMQPVSDLGNQPRAVVFTAGFDPLRDVGIEYAGKLQQAGVSVKWVHNDDMTHGWLQMTPWSHGARDNARVLGNIVGEFAYGG